MSTPIGGSNWERLKERWRKRAERVGEASRSGLREWALAVERRQIANLSGGGEPWSYPVPVRSNALRGASDITVLGPHEMAVLNRSDHARAIHSGVFTSRTGEEYVAGQPRRFLEDAAEAVPGLELVRKRVREEALAI